MYWDAVLKEVLNQDKDKNKDKDDKPCKYTVTNIKDYKYKHETARGQVREKRGTFTVNKLRRELVKYPLGKKYPGVYFTARETQAMYYFLQGKTANEVSKEMNLSRRTVEFYLKNMRAKLNCDTKLELIDKILQSELKPGP